MKYYTLLVLLNLSANIFSQIPNCYKTGGIGEDQIQSIIRMPDNGYFICGATSSFPSQTEIDSFPVDYFVEYDQLLLKLDDNLSPQWMQVRETGFAYTETLEDAFISSDNKLIVGGLRGSDRDTSYGSYVGALDLSGQYLWEKSYFDQSGDVYFYRGAATSNGKSYWAGWVSDTPYTAMKYTGFISKLDETGIIEWAWNIGDSSFGTFILNLKVLADGSVLVVGHSTTNQQTTIPLVALFSSSGSLLKMKVFDTPYPALFRNVEQFGDGFILGGDLLNNENTHDCFILKLDSSLNVINASVINAEQNLDLCSDMFRFKDGWLILSQFSEVYYLTDSFDPIIGRRFNESAFSISSLVNSDNSFMIGLMNPTEYGEFVYDDIELIYADSNLNACELCQETISFTTSPLLITSNDTLLNLEFRTYSQEVFSTLIQSNQFYFEGICEPTPLSLSNNGKLNCTLYPIPFTNQLKIDCGNSLKAKLILHDILGKQILNTEFTSGEVINIPEFVSSGLYFYEILNGLEYYTGKVMKN